MKMVKTLRFKCVNAYALYIYIYNVYFESWSLFRRKHRLAEFFVSYMKLALHMYTVLKSMTGMTYYL